MSGAIPGTTRGMQAVFNANNDPHPQWSWGDNVNTDEPDRLVRPVLLFEGMCPMCSGAVERCEPPAQWLSYCPYCNLSWRVRTPTPGSRAHEEMGPGALICTVRRGRGHEHRAPRRVY